MKSTATLLAMMAAAVSRQRVAALLFGTGSLTRRVVVEPRICSSRLSFRNHFSRARDQGGPLAYKQNQSSSSSSNYGWNNHHSSKNRSNRWNKNNNNNHPHRGHQMKRRNSDMDRRPTPFAPTPTPPPGSTTTTTFRPGDRVQVEVMSFGPLGASVEIVAHHTHNPNDVKESALATGMVLQKEIAYFRQARGNVDVVQGEILPAYVERVRWVEQQDDNDQGQEVLVRKLDIGLRAFGGKAKAQSIGAQILQALEQQRGTLPIGDKSTPAQVARVLPGVSKGAFKKAVSALYRQGKVQPGPQSIRLMRRIAADDEDEEELSS